MKQKSPSSHGWRILTLLTNTYLALLFSLFLLWPGTNGYVAIQQAKTNGFYLLAGGYLILLTVMTLELILIGKLKFSDFKTLVKKSTLSQKLVILYWLLTAISTALSSYRKDALLGMSRNEGLFTISLYCATFLCISIFAKPGRWLGWILSVTMTVFDSICLLQMARYNPLGLFPVGVDYFDANKKFAGVYLGTTGNAGLTAAVLCMTLPLLLGMVLREKNKLRWIALVPATLNVVVLIQSNVQAGLLGVVLGLLLGMPMMFGSGRKRNMAWGITVASLLCGLVLVLSCPGQSGTLYELNQLLHGNFDPEFGNGRIHIWKEVLVLIPENLWFGTGPDTMKAFSIQGLSWKHAPSGTIVPLMVDIAHNEYLNVLFHQGILALAAYLGALAVSAGKWLRTDSLAVAALGTGLLCYCIQAFFGFSMNASAAVFWALWALMENRCERTEETP